MARKNIGKKLRFAVFKRDGFRCQYCGRTPPVVVLEIDHVSPIAKGGTDDINNLATACFDCNRGKSDGLLADVPHTVAEKAAILREKELQLTEYNELLRAKRARETRAISRIERAFQVYFPDRQFTDSFRESIRSNFLPSFSTDDLEQFMSKASSYINVPDRAIKYFCGICWKKKKEFNSNGEGA